MLQRRLEEAKDHFQILLKSEKLPRFSLTNKGAFLLAVEKGSSSLIAHPKME